MSDSTKFWNKGYMLGKICPVWVADVYGQNRVKGRLWGKLTLPFVSLYCQFIIGGFPMLIEDKNA